MIQTHQQLKEISEEYNTLFSKNEFYPVQKAYTTPHFLVLGLRFPGKNVMIYIGRGNQYEGIFLGSSYPPSYLRIQDRLLDYVRKYLVGCRLGKMEVDNKHFASLFHYKNDHTDNSLSFGYKEHQLFFINQSKEVVYTSWNGESLTNKEIPALIDELLGEKNNLKESTNSEWSLDKYFIEEGKKVSGKLIQKKKEKFLEKKFKNITNDLVDVSSWEDIEKELLEDKVPLLDEHQVIIHGHKVKFSGNMNPWQKRDAIFNKIKKLKKAQIILSNRLEETRLELNRVKEGNFDFEITKEKAIAPLWRISGQVKNKGNESANVKSFKIKNISGLISLDAQSNDWLRAQGVKDHYWFHIENYPGAHCLIKTDDLSHFTNEEFSAIASLLRDYSGLEIVEIPVMFSQLKHVKGVKGSKGEVIVKKLGI